MEKITTSLSVIAIVVGLSFGAIGVTGTYFSDVETSEGNTFQAGTLDLTLGSTLTLPFDVVGTYPGDSGTGEATVNNDGTLDGVLDAKLDNLSDLACDDGGLADSSEYCDTSADLAGALEVGIWLDVDQSGDFSAGDFELNFDGTKTAYDGSTNIAVDNYDTLANYNETAWNDIRTMSSGGSDDFMIEWQLPTDTGNAVQGDKATFDVNFQLRQSDASGL